MYYRNPDHLDLNRLTRAPRVVPEPRPVSLASRLILSVGMIAAPVIAFLLVLGIGRLIAAL